MINKNLLIFILGIFILLKLRNKNLESNKCNQKEYMINNQNEEVDISNSVKVFQDADKILNNLNKELSIKLLINNNLIIPWIKNMEESEAEKLYERLFEDNTLDENLTMNELLYGKTGKDGNTIIDGLLGIDLDISQTNLLKNKKDVQEYNELTKFLKNVYLEEMMEWGNKFNFEFITNENNILSSVVNPSLKEIKNIPLQIININSDKINTKIKDKISFNINDLADEDQKDKLKNSLKIRYFKIKYIGLDKKPQTNLIKFENKLEDGDIIFSFINKKELNSLPIMEENIPIMEENIPIMEKNIPIMEENIPIMEENIPIMEENQFRNNRNNKSKIKDNTNVKIFPVISLFLKSKSKSVEVNGKKYKFKLDKIGNINDIIDPTNWSEDDYKLSFPSSFPNQYKLRVRNNKSNIYSALSNIINSFGIKQGLDWNKTILDGKVILDTTMGPNNISSLNKNVLNRIVKLDIKTIDRPKKFLSRPIERSNGMNCLNRKEVKDIYNALLNIKETKFDSDDSYLPQKIVNNQGQVIFPDESDPKKKLTEFLKILDINNIYKSEKKKNKISDNFIKSNNDILGFPWTFKDPEPFIWDLNGKRKNEKLNEKVQLIRKKVENDQFLDLNQDELKSKLEPGQVIFGPNDTVLCKIEYEAELNQNDEIIGLKTIYLDKNNNKYSININESIAWKLDSLKKLFDTSSSNILKEQIALINKLIVIRANAILSSKKRLIDSIRQPKMSINNILDLKLQNSKAKKKCVTKKLSDLLTNYSLIITPKAPVYSEEDILKMNRKNMVSILENGVQSLERILIYNKCIEIDQNTGDKLMDVNDNNIHFIGKNDILRLQRCIFSSLNKSISSEDNLSDIYYATKRLQLILEQKNDPEGSFILYKINDMFEKEMVQETIGIIKNISLEENVNIDINYQENIINYTKKMNLSLEKLNQIYKYITLNDYFSVTLDLINDTDYFKGIIDEIDPDDRPINYKYSDWPDSKKKKAKDAIKTLKERTEDMSDWKKTTILNVIKSNIISRQTIKDNDLVINNFVESNVTLNTPFYLIKEYFYDEIIEHPSHVIEEEYIFNEPIEHPSPSPIVEEEYFTDIVTGYSSSSYYYI